MQIERWHVARLSVIGRFFDGYRRDPSESLATTAIGAIGYYADMQIYDIHGLVDIHIAHMPPPPGFGTRRPGHGRSDLKYTFSLKPTYVMFSRDLDGGARRSLALRSRRSSRRGRSRLRADLGVADRRA